jgi:ribosomal-protein-alanine N-acetyltransferase
MFIPNPTLTDGELTVRPIRMRDAKQLERELMFNRGWLRPWEATLPGTFNHFDTKASIRSLLAYARSGGGLPLVLEVDDAVIGQINVSGITHGSLSSASVGYWVAQRFAGRALTPRAVALVTDYCFMVLGLHRIEICIRPENAASLRVVNKLGFRFEGRRDRYIHINGDWRDHDCFALCVDDMPEGVLARFHNRKPTRLNP